MKIVVGFIAVVGTGVVVGGSVVVVGGRVVLMVVNGATVVGWLVGSCLAVTVVITGAAVVFATGSLIKTHTPLIHAPALLLHSVPSATIPFGMKKLPKPVCSQKSLHSSKK